MNSPNISVSIARRFTAQLPSSVRPIRSALRTTPSPSREIFALERNMLQMRLVTIPFRSPFLRRTALLRQILCGALLPRFGNPPRLSQMRQTSFPVCAIILMLKNSTGQRGVRRSYILGVGTFPNMEESPALRFRSATRIHWAQKETKNEQK